MVICCAALATPFGPVTFETDGEPVLAQLVLPTLDEFCSRFVVVAGIVASGGEADDPVGK